MPKTPSPDLKTHPLAICLRILEALGEPGRVVWELGKLYVERRKEPLTQDQRLAYLRKAISHLRAKADENARTGNQFDGGMWRELPVDFRTFVDSPAMMNKTGVLWPSVLAEGEEINSGKYVECVLTGGIGVAKSTLAIYTQAYQTYILSCMNSPHEVFDLDPSSEILIVFQSVNKNVATDVDYRRLRDMIAGSPYFERKFPFQKDRESDMRFPKNVIIKPVAGHDTAAIGQNVIGGILDEINFMAVVENSKQSKDGGTYDQATQNYNSIASRRESRFMQLGSLPGMLCLVSSRNYPGQFTDRKEEEARTNPRIYVYDKRIWELRPDRFCGEKFQVFIGDATRKPRVLLDGEAMGERDAHLVMSIPVEFRQAFDSDIMTALRDKAGVATQALHPFMMNTDAIAAAFGTAKSVLSREACDFVNTRVTFYPRRVVNPEQPRFVHLDPSRSRDSFGMACGHVPGFVEVDRGDVIEMMPVIQYDFTLEIIPPKGGEIEYSNIRKLLYALRANGLPIKWVTSDTFQSTDNLQILKQQGFIVGEASMDTDTLAYDILRQAVYDRRVMTPLHARAQSEMVRLEVDPKTQKIDHPPNGSKDVTDAMAGVAKGLTMRQEVWAKHGVSTRSKPKIIAEAAERTKSEPKTYSEVLRVDRQKRWDDERRTNA